MKILNLYAGIGGNRKLWGDKHDIVVVEINSEIAEIYNKLFPKDYVVVRDAHQYLLDAFKEFDFIWSSPPCPSHSQFRHRCGTGAWGYKPIYPDMKLYEEIVFLQHHFKGAWVIENVMPYYEPLLKPQKVGRHCLWANFIISKKKGFQEMKIKGSEIPALQKLHGIDLSGCELKDKRKVLRNCVLPELGLHIFNCAFKNKQMRLGGQK